jgi:hypothetical protein
LAQLLGQPEVFLTNAALVQAKSAETTIERNAFFNGPRALININDGRG